jgi:predicted DNA-binding protein (MmcQ/YjbR family)
MAKDPRRLRTTLERYALALPEATSDMPWEGDVVAKVRGKIFVFFGLVSIGVKLPESFEHAVSLEAGTPTRYGLGRHRWATIDLSASDCPGRDVLQEWIDESYRAVAPKTLVRQLDAS